MEFTGAWGEAARMENKYFIHETPSLPPRRCRQQVFACSNFKWKTRRYLILLRILLSDFTVQIGYCPFAPTCQSWKASFKTPILQCTHYAPPGYIDRRVIPRNPSEEKLTCPHVVKLPTGLYVATEREKGQYIKCIQYQQMVVTSLYLISSKICDAVLLWLPYKKCISC